MLRRAMTLPQAWSLREGQAVRVETEDGTQMVEVAQSHQIGKDGTIRFRAKSADEKVPLEVMGEFTFGKERKP